METFTYESLLKEYGITKEPLSGKNVDGEIVMLDVSEDHATIKTFQDNGWIRVHVYWKDGTVEERYER